MTVPANGLERRTERELGSLQRRDAYRASLVIASLVLVAELAFTAIDLSWSAPALLVSLRLAHAFLALGLLIALVLLRKQFRWGHGDLVLVIVGLPFLPIFWIAELAVAALGEPWAPFVGAKLTAVGLAMLTPARLWLGALFVALYVGEALAIWTVEEFARHAALLATGEPWVTVSFGVLALVMLGYRARTRRTEQEFIRTRVQAESLEALARIFLAVRDRANTPLQTLEVGVALLEKRHPDAAPIAARMERALSRLRSLSGTLSRHRPIDWEPGAQPPDLDALLDALEARRENRANGARGPGVH